MGPIGFPSFPSLPSFKSLPKVKTSEELTELPTEWEQSEAKQSIEAKPGLKARMSVGYANLKDGAKRTAEFVNVLLFQEEMGRAEKEFRFFFKGAILSTASLVEKMHAKRIERKLALLQAGKFSKDVSKQEKALHQVQKIGRALAIGFVGRIAVLVATPFEILKSLVFIPSNIKKAIVLDKANRSRELSKVEKDENYAKTVQKINRKITLQTLATIGKVVATPLTSVLTGLTLMVMGPDNLQKKQWILDNVISKLNPIELRKQ